ncbi:MAG: class I SAM-dependent RNA methyltransferase [Acidobacteria bacterium]|nr:class I SAM-dependent RNA methyltransferase [Acidobacteriota bacterium]
MINNELIIGQELELTVEKLIYGGQGLARFQGNTIFIPSSAVGDKLKVQITSVEKNFFQAKILQILEPSIDRRTPPCEYFEECGGCQLQHLNYNAQLQAKADFIKDSLKRIGRFDWQNTLEIIHSNEFNYRNRTQLKIERTSSPIGIGFYKEGSHKVCNIENCLILAKELNQALEALRKSEKEISLSEIPYSKIDLIKGNLEISASQIVAGLSSNAIYQRVLDIDYYFDPGCFFQVNQYLLNSLIEIVVGERTGKIALDLYAGVGFFALQLAKNYQKVIATEVNKKAEFWATHNMKVNNISNVEFFSFSTEKWLGKFSRKFSGVDLVVLDPPRVGIIKKTLLSITEMRPKEIVYVSCDPSTLARDLRVLVDNGYKLVSIIGVDLFPQTYHIETVAILKRA